jgi:hypothetical protein
MLAHWLADFQLGIEIDMPDPKTPIVPATKAPATNPPAAPPVALPMDERFAQLAAQFMAQVNAQLEAARQEFATQFSTTVDPLHKDLHDLLDQQLQAAARLDKLEAANFVTVEGLKEHADQIGDAIAEKLAPKVQPVIQPAITVTDRSLADRITKIESRLKFF